MLGMGIVGIALLAVAGICALGLGCYWWGYHRGRSEGREQGLAEAPLQLRERALTEPRCPVCGLRTSAS